MWAWRSAAGKEVYFGPMGQGVLSIGRIASRSSSLTTVLAGYLEFLMCQHRMAASLLVAVFLAPILVIRAAAQRMAIPLRIRTAPQVPEQNRALLAVA